MIKETAQQVAKTAEHTFAVSAPATTTFSLWAWIGDNSSEITAACAIIGMLITVASGGVTIWMKLKKNP